MRLLGSVTGRAEQAHRTTPGVAPSLPPPVPASSQRRQVMARSLAKAFSRYGNARVTLELSWMSRLQPSWCGTQLTGDANSGSVLSKMRELSLRSWQVTSGFSSLSARASQQELSLHCTQVSGDISSLRALSSLQTSPAEARVGATPHVARRGLARLGTGPA